MSNPVEEPRQPHMWLVYWILILSAAASCTGRIFSVLRDKETPFLSANDRSRWCTIRALVDHGTYVIDDIIDDVIIDPKSKKEIKPWQTIDLVRHRGIDGREHYYSSKPVFMPTVMAGVYAVVKKCTGCTLEKEPFFVGRIVLWLCNMPPLLLSWFLLAKMFDRYAIDDWTRLFAIVAATAGTFLTTYTIALNNHLHAAVCVVIAIYFLVRILHDANHAWWNYFACGLFGALVFANELPGLAFLALIGVSLLIVNWQKTLLAFLPASAGIVLAMVLLNFYAHNSWRPAYAHRNDGPIVASGSVHDLVALRRGEVKILLPLLESLSDSATLSPRLVVNPGDSIKDRWVLWDESHQNRYAVQLTNESSGAVEIRAWDNWYEYEGTYWTVDKKKGVDLGEQSPLTYALHVLIGHHGLFSLTPIWIFAVSGMVLLLFRGPPSLRLISVGTLLLTLVCLAFYLSRPLQDRNYGGVCNGLRWMMWFIPLYLLTMLPIIAWLGKTRVGRTFAALALALGIFSASYKPMNCFSAPWIFDLLEYLKLIHYGP